MSFRKGFAVDPELDLSADEAEILSSISFSASKAAAKSIEEENAQAYQERLALQAKKFQADVADELGSYYENGNTKMRVARDKRKATKFRRQGTEAAIKVRDEQRASAVRLFGKERSTTEYFDNVSWFSSARLFAWRLHRVISVISKASPLVILLNSYGGLSYIFELIVDIYNIGKATFAPTDEQRAAMPRWQDRFKITATKDERPMRMLNAVMWFCVNLACFFMTGGVSAIVNTTFFAADLCVDSYKAMRDYFKYRGLLKKIDAKIERLTRELQELTETLPDRRNETKEQKELRIAKQTELDEARFLRTTIAKKQKEAVKLKTFFVVATTLVLVGMILFFFPPAAPLMIAGLAISGKLIGACLAFSGSVMTFGRRIVKKSEAKWAERAAKKPKKEKPANPNDIELNDLSNTPCAQLLSRNRPSPLTNNATMLQSLTKESPAPDGLGEVKSGAWSDAGVEVARPFAAGTSKQPVAEVKVYRHEIKNPLPPMASNVVTEEKSQAVSEPIPCPSTTDANQAKAKRAYASSLDLPLRKGDSLAGATQTLYAKSLGSSAPKDVLYPMRTESRFTKTRTA